MTVVTSFGKTLRALTSFNFCVDEKVLFIPLHLLPESRYSHSEQRSILKSFLNSPVLALFSMLEIPPVVTEF